MDLQVPDTDLINFDSPRLPQARPEIEVSGANEDGSVDKENLSGVGNEVVYLDSTFRLTDNSKKSVCNESANEQLIDLAQDEGLSFVKFQADDSGLQRENESYAALGIRRGDISNGNESAAEENSLNEKLPKFESVDCSNEKGPAEDDVSNMSVDVTCYCDSLEVLPAASPNDKRPDDQNATMKPNDAVEAMDETVVDTESSSSEFIRNAAEFMTLAYEGPVDLDISDFIFESHSTGAEMEKQVIKINEQSQEERQILNEKTMNTINCTKTYESTSEDVQYLYWQKAILDREFKKNSELAARGIEETVDRTEEIQRQIDIVDDLTFESQQLNEMRERVKLMIDLIHRKDETIDRLNDQVDDLEREVSRVQLDAAKEQEMIRIEYCTVADDLYNQHSVITEKLEKLSEENDKLKNRQVEKEVETQNLLKTFQGLKIVHERDLATLRNEVEQLKIDRENDWAKLSTEMAEKFKAEEAKAFNYYVAIKTYEESWNTFHAKYDKLQRTNRKMGDDLGILEVAFKNVVDKFEKSKSLIEGYKRNEAIYEENIQKYKAKLDEEYERYKTFKTHATTRFEEANKQYLEMRVAGDTTARKQSAIIRRLEIKLSATEDLLMQKNTECDRLAKLCDEVTGRV